MLLLAAPSIFSMEKNSFKTRQAIEFAKALYDPNSPAHVLPQQVMAYIFDMIHYTSVLIRYGGVTTITVQITNMITNDVVWARSLAGVSVGPLGKFFKKPEPAPEDVSQTINLLLNVPIKFDVSAHALRYNYYGSMKLPADKVTDDLVGIEFTRAPWDSPLGVCAEGFFTYRNDAHQPFETVSKKSNF